MPAERDGRTQGIRRVRHAEARGRRPARRRCWGAVVRLVRSLVLARGADQLTQPRAPRPGAVARLSLQAGAAGRRRLLDWAAEERRHPRPPWQPGLRLQHPAVSGGPAARLSVARERCLAAGRGAARGLRCLARNRAAVTSGWSRRSPEAEREARSCADSDGRQRATMRDGIALGAEELTLIVDPVPAGELDETDGMRRIEADLVFALRNRLTVGYRGFYASEA